MTDKDYLKHVGSKIRDARVDRGISAFHLSYMAGMTPRALSFIETGKVNTGLLNIRRIADALKVDTRDLI